MGIFRRTRSAASRVASAVSAAGPASAVSPDSAAAEPRARHGVEGPALVKKAAAIEIVESKLNGDASGSIEESDVFVCRRSSPDLTPLPIAEHASTVTLFVFGWHHVEPGPLSWSFPSLRAALDAVRTMRNAAQWCIVSGESWASLDAAREGGAVLIEQLG